MQQTLVALSACSLLALGCAAESPDGDQLPGPDAGASEPSDPDLPPQKPVLSLDPLDASTPYLVIAVTGTGPASGQIVFETPTDSGTADIGADGSFCIDVPLEPDVSNRIHFKAANTDGVFSDEVEKIVVQDGDPPDGDNDEEPAPEFRNMAELGPISTNVGVANGDLGALNDGNPDSFVELDNHWWWDNDHFSIELTEQSPLHHIRVRSTDECPMKKYRVLISESANPEEPLGVGYYGYPGADWTEIAVIDGGEGDDVVTPPFGTQPTVSHIAFLLIQGCRGQFTATENFEVLEVEALTERDPPPQTGGDPTGPSCASGTPQ